MNRASVVKQKQKAQFICLATILNEENIYFADKIFQNNSAEKVEIKMKIKMESILQATIKVPKFKKIEIQTNNLSINENLQKFAQLTKKKISSIGKEDDLLRETRKIREEFANENGDLLNEEFERIRKIIGLKSAKQFAKIDQNQFSDIKGVKELLSIFGDNYRNLIYAAYPDLVIPFNNNEKLLCKLYGIFNLGQVIAFTNVFFYLLFLNIQ